MNERLLTWNHLLPHVHGAVTAGRGDDPSGDGGSGGGGETPSETPSETFEAESAFLQNNYQNSGLL